MKRFQEQIIAMLLIFSVAMFGTMVVLMIKDRTDISPVEVEEVEEPQDHCFNIKITCEYTPPDPSYAFMCAENKEIAHEKLEGLVDIREEIDKVEIPRSRMILKDEGTYYITGYTSIECGGSIMTASGATVHKGNPTTCAIDPALWDFGDLFYIPYFDQVYVAEDTGSAVKGKHLDLYFYDDEYNYALSITGYYQVYSVTYEYDMVAACTYDIRPQVVDKVIGWKLTDEMKGIETEEVQKGPYYG